MKLNISITMHNYEQTVVKKLTSVSMFGSSVILQNCDWGRQNNILPPQHLIYIYLMVNTPVIRTDPSFDVSFIKIKHVNLLQNLVVAYYNAGPCRLLPVVTSLC